MNENKISLCTIDLSKKKIALVVEKQFGDAMIVKILQDEMYVCVFNELRDFFFIAC